MKKANAEFQKFLVITGGGIRSARAIGITPVKISHITTGRREVSKDIAKRIIDKYPQISLYNLLFGDAA